MTSELVAVLGTGLLGSGMVENLLRKGHKVRVWNRTRDKLQPLQKQGAEAAADPAAAARGAARVHLVLAADDAVDAVIAALRPGLGAGVPVIDHSTNLPARVAARTADLRKQGVRYVHAPVFMSPQNAREGTGMMLLSASQPDAAALQPALAAMTGKVWHVGERSDLAAFHKLTGNGFLLAVTAVLGDMLTMGDATDVPTAEVLKLFEQWKPGAFIPFLGAMLAKPAGGPVSFELQMARKDIRLMLETAGTHAMVALPAVAAAMDHALAEGRAQEEFAVFARRPAE